MSYCSIEYRKKVGKEIESGVSTPRSANAEYCVRFVISKKWASAKDALSKFLKLTPPNNVGSIDVFKLANSNFVFNAGTSLVMFIKKLLWTAHFVGWYCANLEKI